MKERTDKAMLSSLIRASQLSPIFGDDTVSEMHLYEAEKGEILCSKGDQLTQMYFLLAGKIKIFTTSPNGKSLLLRFNNPLAIVGDIEFISQCEVRNTVEFVQPSLVIGISYKLLQERFVNHPPFLQFILQKISHKLYTSSNSTSLNLLYPVENRFASYLLSTISVESASVELQTSKLTEVAELLGTSYRHLNRVIRNLCDAQIIERKKGALLISDREKIEQLASGNIYE
ncbi:Crp/Fnr family transcriptional regulator [Brevibacillus choshinensis]|uniref:Cyclic nucleotide-binding domain-containing protein n=1 Tax=Brevibacillus choshinensis TaxID=54911 RepID=A0ABX7FNL1_BRECH|nr:cyclic nucleotide-binding domain-containing protein [Brevibacillus choshinensis]QRG66565.1 cyclic nucleotide-binding domain-containing protein [Brevibacillus choshinensis]